MHIYKYAYTIKRRGAPSLFGILTLSIVELTFWHTVPNKDLVFAHHYSNLLPILCHGLQGCSVLLASYRSVTLGILRTPTVPGSSPRLLPGYVAMVWSFDHTGSVGI